MVNNSFEARELTPEEVTKRLNGFVTDVEPPTYPTKEEQIAQFLWEKLAIEKTEVDSMMSKVALDG